MIFSSSGANCSIRLAPCANAACEPPMAAIPPAAADNASILRREIPFPVGMAIPPSANMALFDLCFAQLTIVGEPYQHARDATGA